MLAAATLLHSQMAFAQTCDLPMFAGARLFAAGNDSQQLLTADFNKDGFTDLAVLNAAASSVSILLGNGDGTFQPAKAVFTGRPTGIAVADFDGDGNLDLAVSDQSSFTIQVLLGNGDGTLRPGIRASSQTGTMAVGDFNGDGKPDLALTGTPAYILIGKGDGTFQPPVGPPTAFVAGFNVAIGDANGDGKLDVIAGTQGGVSVLLGDGKGHIADPVSVDAGISFAPDTVVVGDLNGDHRLDIVTVSSLANSVSVLLGNGNGTFQAPAMYGIGTIASGAVLADLNGDGIPDLAVLNHADFTTPGTISVFVGIGDGTFQPTVQYNPTAQANWGIAAADFNSDGVPDLVFSSIVMNSPTQVGLMLGNGDGTFQSPPSYAAGSLPRSPVLADFNGDGVLDVAVADAGISGGNVAVLLGNPNGTFQPAVFYPTAFGAKSVAAGDLNGDGKPDLVVANLTASNLLVFLGNGDGTFQNPVTSGVSFGALYVALGDFNNDGKLDAAVTGPVGGQVLLGNGDGTFRGGASLGSCLGCGQGPVTIADLNGDGNLDLVMANSNFDTPTGFGRAGTVTVYLGNGNGSFQNGVDYNIFPAVPPGPAASSGANATWVAIGDINGDGALDLAVADPGGNQVSQPDGGALAVLLGNGDGTFQSAVRYAVRSVPVVVAMADVNGDGLADVAVASEGAGTATGSVTVYLSNGDGTLRNAITYGAGGRPLGMTVGDLNGDGKPDLVTIDDQANNVLVMLNTYIPGSSGSACTAAPLAH